PAIEFGLGGLGHADPVVFAGQAQQEPLLLLTDTDRLGMAAYQPLRQPVTQPAAGAGENLHILGHQPNLFVQLAEQCLLGALVTLGATLRKLPGLLTDTPGPQLLPQPIGQDDAYIGAKAVGVDHCRYPWLLSIALFHKDARPSNCINASFAKHLPPF